MTDIIENTHYEFVPRADDRWAVRLLEGDYPETIIEYGQVRIDTENDLLRFDFDVEYSPDIELTSDDSDLQGYAASVLGAILTQSFSDGSYKLSDEEQDGNQSRTDDSSQPTD